MCSARQNCFDAFLAYDLVDPADGITGDPCCLKHIWCRAQGLTIFRSFVQRRAEFIDDSLRNGKVARAKQNQYAEL